jgi:hypothetical protein
VTSDDETTITEISILPDGRVCVFGASGDVLEALAGLESRDPEICQRIAYARLLQEPQQRQESQSVT